MCFMIQLSLIDDSFSVFKEKKVFLFGAGYRGHQVKNDIEKNGGKVYAYIDNDSNKKGKIVDGIPVFSPDLILNEKDFVVQISCENETEPEDQLKNLGVKNYITMQEFYQRLYDLRDYKMFSYKINTFEYLDKLHVLDTHFPTQDKLKLWEHLKDVLIDDKQALFLCMPPKTGDWTLIVSLDRLNISYVNLWHSLKRFGIVKDLLLDRKVKIITAVREPISQNISSFFNMISFLSDEKEFWEHGGNVQLLFDKYLQCDLYESLPTDELKYFRRIKEQEGVDYVIQPFFDKHFLPYCDVDVYKENFDHEKGWSIIKDGNLEIFIFQIEKLNTITDALANFIGVEHINLVNENIGSNKWYKKAYRQALTDIVLKKDYFTECMESKILNHFYSKEDISKVYYRWIKHI